MCGDVFQKTVNNHLLNHVSSLLREVDIDSRFRVNFKQNRKKMLAQKLQNRIYNTFYI